MSAAATSTRPVGAATRAAAPDAREEQRCIADRRARRPRGSNRRARSLERRDFGVVRVQHPVEPRERLGFGAADVGAGRTVPPGLDADRTCRRSARDQRRPPFPSAASRNATNSAAHRKSSKGFHARGLTARPHVEVAHTTTAGCLVAAPASAIAPAAVSRHEHGPRAQARHATTGPPRARSGRSPYRCG